MLEAHIVVLNSIYNVPNNRVEALNVLVETGTCTDKSRVQLAFSSPAVYGSPVSNGRKNGWVVKLPYTWNSKPHDEKYFMVVRRIQNSVGTRWKALKSCHTAIEH